MRNYMAAERCLDSISHFFNALATADSLLFLTSDLPEFG